MKKKMFKIKIIFLINIFIVCVFFEAVAFNRTGEGGVCSLYILMREQDPKLDIHIFEVTGFSRLNGECLQIVPSFSKEIGTKIFWKDGEGDEALKLRFRASNNGGLMETGDRAELNVTGFVYPFGCQEKYHLINIHVEMQFTSGAESDFRTSRMKYKMTVDSLLHYEYSEEYLLWGKNNMQGIVLIISNLGIPTLL